MLGTITNELHPSNEKCAFITFEYKFNYFLSFHLNISNDILSIFSGFDIFLLLIFIAHLIQV